MELKGGKWTVSSYPKEYYVVENRLLLCEKSFTANLTYLLKSMGRWHCTVDVWFGRWCGVVSWRTSGFGIIIIFSTIQLLFSFPLSVTEFLNLFVWFLNQSKIFGKSFNLNFKKIQKCVSNITNIADMGENESGNIKNTNIIQFCIFIRKMLIKINSQNV